MEQAIRVPDKSQSEAGELKRFIVTIPENCNAVYLFEATTLQVLYIPIVIVRIYTFTFMISSSFSLA